MNKIENFKQFGVSLGYKRLKKLGDRLEPISNLIDWDKLGEFFVRISNVGRPPYDPVLMIKMMVLQSWYGISDEELEYQVADRISFQKFLGFPKEIPHFTTYWKFKERTTQEQMNIVETHNMTTLEQLHGELSRQCEMECNFFEQFHTSLQEITMLLNDQEQEIQKLEQL